MPPVLAQVQETVPGAKQSGVPNYPAPVLTPKNVKVDRKLPSFTPPTSGFQLPENPTDGDIFSHSLFEEPLVPVGGKTTSADNAALGQALTAFSKRTERDDYSALENFLQANPASPWRLALLTNLGWSYRQTGWYSKAMELWRMSLATRFSEQGEPSASNYFHLTIPVPKTPFPPAPLVTQLRRTSKVPSSRFDRSTGSPIPTSCGFTW